MRLVVARCSVDYEGRLSAHLPLATRLIMVKADGCVAIHADGGAYKPLNWMNAPNRLVEGDGSWTVVNPAGERLIITIDEVLSDTAHELGADPGLQKDGVEAHLQELLAAACDRLELGMVLVRREHRTEIGPVDLLCRDSEGRAVAIEIKRQGGIDGVEQLARYLEFLERDPTLRPVRGMFVAQVIKPQAKALAAERGITCIEVDYDALRGVERAQTSLFQRRTTAVYDPPWSDATALRAYRSSFGLGTWDAGVRGLDELDPHRVFSNPTVDRLIR